MLIQGILLGISLSFMVGPLLFSIVQAGIERGFRAGLAVAGGIWFSDVLYVLLVQYGMEALTAVTSLPDFRLWSGLAGGMLLAAFGLGNLFFKKTPGLSPEKTGGSEAAQAGTARNRDMQNDPDAGLPDAKHRTYFAYWLRGFLMNTVNPFTVFFWLGIAGAIIIPNGWQTEQILVFFGGMLGTLVVTDTLKAYAAKRVRRFLTPGHIQWVQRGIGFLLLVFGAVLVARVL